MHYPVTFVALAALIAVSSVSAEGIYSKASSVLQVDAKSYDKLIKNSNKASIVEFYAPWCGHCKNLKPAYEKAAKSLEGLANVAAVNCDDEENKAFCGSMGIKGFPTLKTVRPTLKKGKSIQVDYSGARTAAGIVEAVKDIIPNHVTRVSDKELDKWLKDDNSTAKAILFSNKGTTSATIKVLAGEFYGNMHFAQVRDKDTTAVSIFGISEYPTLIVLPGGAAPAVAYSGEMTKAPMAEFLSQYASVGTGFQDSKASKQKPIAKDKASTDSSTFSAASAAHKASEGSDAAASATTITLEEPNGATPSPDPIATDEDAPVPASMPDVAPPLQTLSTQAELRAQCLGPKTPTCILALLPASPINNDAYQLPESATSAMASLSSISEKHKVRGSHLFPFFAVSARNEGNTVLREGLGLEEGIQLVAINGRRWWWRGYDAQKGFGKNAVEDWIDAMRLGEGKKEKLPEGLVSNVDTEDVTESAKSATSVVGETVESATSQAEETASSITDKVKDKAAEATDVVSGAAESAADKAKSIKSQAGESAASATESAGETIASATSVVSESAASAASAASAKASSVSSVVGDTASSVSSVVTETAASVTSVLADTASSATSIVGESAASAASQASSAASSATSIVSNSASSLADKAKATASSASSAASSAASGVSSSIASASSVAAQTATSAASSASSAASSVSSKASSAASSVGSSAADAASTVTSQAAAYAGDAGASVSSASDKAASAASSASSKASSVASSVSASAAGKSGAADNLGEKVGKKVDSVTSVVGEKVEQATAAAKAKVEGVRHEEL
ncbi:hypothetical protein MMC34_001251 [Xylographa carneopallida]|nr:hypothetical protein [Xylographa carneopallida]